MTPDHDLTAAVRDRPHWSVDSRAVVYATPDATATVRIQAMAQPTRTVHYVASVIRAGRAEYSRPAGSATEAITWAERVPLT